jgi:putative ribosome biogenesis GTPase RsgA
MHLAEPGCAVTAADPERYEHYVKFLAEIKVRFQQSSR